MFLVRINPERNERRFYVIEVAPSVLGPHCVQRIYGRLGGFVRVLPPVVCAD